MEYKNTKLLLFWLGKKWAANGLTIVILNKTANISAKKPGLKGVISTSQLLANV